MRGEEEAKKKMRDYEANITSSSFADMIDKTVLKTVTTPANNENDSSETQEQPKKRGQTSKRKLSSKNKREKIQSNKNNMLKRFFVIEKKKGTKKGTKKTMFVKRK